MAEYVPIATLDEMPPGSRKVVAIDGREIALFSVGDAFYAIDNTCPHQGGPLVEGWLEGTTITCPWHAWCFDLRTGAMTLGDFSTVETFEIRIDGRVISIATPVRTP